MFLYKIMIYYFAFIPFKRIKIFI